MWLQRLVIVLPLMLLAFEGEIESGQAIQPWFTGPILTTSGEIVPLGHFAMQPYIYGIARTAFYNDHWKSEPIDTLATLQFRMPTWIGLTSWADVKITPVWVWNHRHHQSQWNLGDWIAQIDIQLYQSSLPYRNWLPSIKVSIRETFPTGKYQKLDPKKLGTDGSGRGTFATTFSLDASKILHFSNYHFLDLRANFSYSIPTKIHVKGYNQYGGGLRTNGTISPEKIFIARFAFEYSLDRNWVICCDLEGVFDSKVTFKGNPGKQPSNDGLFNPTGVPAVNELKPAVQYSVAPGIEYNWSEDLGLLAGVWLSFAGKNSSNFTTGVLSLNYFH